MRVRVGLGVLVAVATGCQPDSAPSAGSGESSTSEEGCEWLSASRPMAADAPLCGLDFREVMRLEGSIDGTIPDAPVRALRDGTYITGTYSRGKLALWGPDGELLDVLGRGPGDGPGEFDYVTNLVLISDGAFIVFGPPPLVHEYSRAEGFVRSFRLPAHGSVSSGVTYGDQVILSVAATDDWQAYRIDGDRVQAMGVPLGSSETFPMLTAAEDLGMWSANTDRYVLRKHDWPGGTMVDSLVLSRDWFSGPGGSEALIYGLHADGHGLIWALAQVPDPDAPRRPPGDLDAPIVDEEVEAETIGYTDHVIEALTPDGRLVASVRFDSFEDAAYPVVGNLWYRPTPDRLSIVILEAFLVAR